MKLEVLTGAFLMGVAAYGSTWYVDAARYGKAGNDGLTETTAFGTIQEGVDAAAADGGTVSVLPGTYDQDSSWYNKSKDNTLSRVVISNDVKVIARDGAAATFIVGAADFENEPDNGLGENAVRCVTMIGTKAVLQGFTLTGGHVYQSTGTDWSTVRGGGVYCVDSVSSSNGDSTYPFIVDCVISNNVATRGAGGFYGVYVRTRFTANRAANTGSKSTLVNGAACRSCSLYNCVIDDNGFGGKKSSIVAYVKAIVNCTLTGNLPEGTLLGEGSSVTVKNTILEHVGTVRSSATNYPLSHCLENGVLSESSEQAPYSLAAAPFGDFRPVTGSAILAAGDVAALNDVPETYQDKDFLGNSRTTDGTVSIGAVETPVTPAGGVLTVTDTGLYANGTSLQKNAYFHAVAWPQQVYLTADASSDSAQALFGYDLMTNGVDLCTLFPDRQSGRWVTMPRTDGIWSFAPKYAAVIKVDAASTAETEDGSAAAPFKTIQAAVDSFGTSNYRVIDVAEGDYYGTNTLYSNWGASSVVISYRKVFLHATGDVAKTRLHGVRDKTSETGCGSASSRCLAIGDSGSRVGVSGFTFVDGTTQMAENGWDAWGQGGAVIGHSTPKQQFLDCVVTNCAAFRGCAATGGWWQRCLFVGNADPVKSSGINSTVRNGVLSSCVLRDNDVYLATVNEGSSLYSCTGRGNGVDDYNYYSSGNGCTIVNSLLLDGKNTIGSAGTYVGVFCDTAGAVPTAAGFTSGSAGVVSKADGDFRPFTTSPLLGAGSTAPDDFAFYTVSDFENKAIRFEAGKPAIGAYTHAVGTIVVSNSPNVTFESAGANAVEDGATATVAIDPEKNLSRHVIGLVVDGVAKTNVYSCTFTGAAETAHTVEAITSGDWYVDAEKGSDGNNGFTSETAKKTLVAAMTHVLPGDVVHAAEGTYDQGDAVAAKFSASTFDQIRSRVVVSNGVSLVADGSREKTVIKGGPATAVRTPTANRISGFGTYQELFDNYGLGLNPVRGVTLYPNATVRGFTIADGRSDIADNKDRDDCVGSAVFGFDAETSLVEDCFLTNNMAGRATVYQVTASRCTFIGNVGLRDTSLARKAKLVNVYATANIKTPLTSDGRGFYNCTFIDNYNDLAKTNRRVWLSSEPANPVDFINSILLQDSYSTSSTNYFRNVKNAILGKVNWEASGETVNVKRVALDAPVLDANGVPLKERPAMDAGDVSWAPEGSAELDCAKNPRVSNGMMDIGAFEYDWRGDYAKALGCSHVCVTEASPEVFLNGDGQVEMPCGRLAATLVADARAKTYTLRFGVTGTGSLTLAWNGVAKTYTRGTYEITLRAAEGATPLSFDYAMGEDDAGAALLASIRPNVGMTVILR